MTNFVSGVFSRDQLAPARDLPTINANDGTFSGPFPPASGAAVTLGSVVPELVGNEGGAAARLDSIQMGSAYTAVPHVYWFTAGPFGLDPAASTTISYPIQFPEEVGINSASTNFSAGQTDPAGQLQRRTDLDRAMRQLTARERALLWLAYAEGSSHREIAAAVGVKLASVKLLLFRARRKLACSLTKQGPC